MKTQILKSFALILSISLLAGFTRPSSFEKSDLGRLSGKITNQLNNTPIPFANIVLTTNNIIVRNFHTGADGSFLMENLGAGTYQAKISATGFRELMIHNVIILPEKTTSLNKNLTALPPTPLPSPSFMEISYDEEVEEVLDDSSYEMDIRQFNTKNQSSHGSANNKRVAASRYELKVSDVSSCVRTSEWTSQHNTESYDHISENEFKDVESVPLSTLSIDVDAASYANVRRFINSGTTPPKDAVRIEEMINYFTYDYPNPTGEHPFSITTEVADCPWNNNNKLIHVGIQGQKIAAEQMPASNLVFLIDVSGSMGNANKLPLLKQSLKLLVENMRAEDRIAMVVYAGAAGVVLPSTPGDHKLEIIAALDRLNAGGSTAGGAGIKLAYKIAQENFIQDGNNRIILATDGDFNVGASSNGDMVTLIEEKRKSGVFLTALGYGMGNYKDSKMEQISNAGNSNYAYIDNIMEAKKVLVNEMSGTLLTIAKDVKIQIEFNPHKIASYKLIGYENRLLNPEDFNDDKKDAGELGSGHTVTAIYEVVPKGMNENSPRKVDVLRYQTMQPALATLTNDELMTVKFRYKNPDEENSILITKRLNDSNKSFTQSSENFKFSACVAEFGLLLRDSKHKSKASFDHVIATAKSAKGKDEFGYRAEFIRMVETTQLLERASN